jgi:hypothetical protein
MSLFAVECRARRYGELMVVLAVFIGAERDRVTTIEFLSDLIAAGIVPAGSPLCPFIVIPSHERTERRRSRRSARLRCVRAGF